MKLRELWGRIKSIYLILYGGLVIPFGLLTALDVFGIHDRITWNEEFIVFTSVPLVLYVLVWLWKHDAIARREATQFIVPIKTDTGKEASQ